MSHVNLRVRSHVQVSVKGKRKPEATSQLRLSGVGTMNTLINFIHVSGRDGMWGRQERALHRLPLASVRPALCPQITSSSVCQVPPVGTISLKAHGDRKLSGLSYFWVRRKNQLLMWTQNLQPHHSSQTPELLVFPKSNLLMPDFCFKSFCNLLIVSEINEWMSPLSPSLLCTYLNFIC